MRYYRYVLGFSLAILSGFVAYSPATADQTVRCESEQFQFKRCPVNTRGEVQIARQLSETPCRRGETWGYDRRGVWVDEGCAGEFHVTGGRARSDHGYYGYGREDDYGYGRFGRYGREYERDPYGYGRDYSRSFPGQTVRCESDHFQFTRCSVETRGDVRLVRQLSETPCRRGETWGYDRRGIWVDEGCAGEFRISRR